MVSAMDDEAQAEKEHIAQEELEPRQPKPEESKVESSEDTTKDTAMDADSERAAQTKRALEQEKNNMVDDDLFTAQEHHDIEDALELSKAEAVQEEAAHGTKRGRLAESQGLTGSELAAKALEDLEAARKELEAKPGSADPAAGISASPTSTAAGPAGTAPHDDVGRSSSSSQGPAPALG